MNQLLTYLIEASVCLAICLVFYRVLLSELTFFNLNRAVLIGMLLISAGFPLLSYPLVQVSQASLDFTLPEFIVGQSAVEEVQTFSWLEIGLMIYGIGVVVMTVHLVFGFVMSQRLIGKARLIKHHELWIAVHPKFIPASFFEYILLPDFDPSRPEIKQIILHESMHVRLFHSWDLLLVQLVKIIFWFNPLVYQFEQSLREVHEYQADQGVTNTYSKKEYSGLLLQLITRGRGFQFMNNFNQFQTKKRIIMMSKSQSANREKGRFFLAIPMIAVLFLMFSCEITPEPEIEGPTQMGENKSPTIGGSSLTARLNVGKDGKEIFDVVETQPNPPGGMAGWNQYLAQNLQYPAQARRMGIEGTVIVVFVVNLDGSISDVEVLRGIGGGADEEAIRVVQNSPLWEPGKQRDRVLNTRMRLPIRFKLGNTSKAEIAPGFEEVIKIPIKN
jgi:TonB family protein